MRVIGRRRGGSPVDTKAQLIDPFGPECRAVLNSGILIPRQVRSREARHIGARGRPHGWNLRGTVIYGVAREQGMGTREIVVDANHTVVLTSCAFVRGD